MVDAIHVYEKRIPENVAVEHITSEMRNYSFTQQELPSSLDISTK